VAAELGSGDFETVERTVDGRILVGGALARAPGSTAKNAVVARFLPTGTLDPTFGSGGVASVAAGSEARVHDLVTVSGGRVVGVGLSVGRDYDTLVWRLTPLGAPDPTFGTNGLTVRGLAPGSDVAWVAVAGPDDTVTVAGGVWPPDRSRRDTLVARFTG
jgi:uncharacterized delta-60 repeat protein